MINHGPSPEAITDVREMRRILTDMRYGGYSPFTKSGDMSSSSGLVRQVMDAGQHMGCSGEDTMTVLAYHALLQLDDAMGRLIHLVGLQPPQHIVAAPRPESPTGQINKPATADGITEGGEK